MSIRIGRPIWFATGMWRSLSTPMLNHACQASLKRLAELEPMTWPGSWQNKICHFPNAPQSLPA